MLENIIFHVSLQNKGNDYVLTHYGPVLNVMKVNTKTNLKIVYLKPQQPPLGTMTLTTTA